MVAKPRHLVNAPIKEALIDLRVRLTPQVADRAIKVIDKLSDNLKEEYPHNKKQYMRIFEHSVTPEGLGKAHVEDKGIVGHMRINEANDQVVQLMTNRFTFSRLRPYETWEQLRDQARRLWDLYREALEPEMVTRIAVRYINRLPLPYPLEDFGDYLATPPTLPPELPQELSDYLIRLEFPDPETGAYTIIHEKHDGFDMDKKTNEPIKINVILDIDTFQNKELVADDEAIWETLEQLHTLKNRIFFASITERAAELYQ